VNFDTVGVARLIEGVEFGGLIADKAFDRIFTKIGPLRDRPQQNQLVAR
jgi:hypothetical protein